jgi:hypothetical protein
MRSRTVLICAVVVLLVLLYVAFFTGPDRMHAVIG